MRFRRRQRQWGASLGIEAAFDLIVKTYAPNLPAPARNHDFLKRFGRRWEIDRAWPDYKVGVELQGGTFAYMGHSRGSGIERDTEKHNMAILDGWLLLYFTTQQIKRAPVQCVRQVQTALLARCSLEGPPRMAKPEGFPTDPADLYTNKDSNLIRLKRSRKSPAPG